MKKSQTYIAFTLFSATITLAAAAGAQAATPAECSAASKRASSEVSLFKTDGTCDLGDDNNSIHAETALAALKNFQAVKAELMTHFDKNTAGTLGADLADLRTTAETFVAAHSSDKPEISASFKGLIGKIDALNKAIDAIRLPYTTNPTTIAAIDHAFGALQDTCDQFSDGNKPFCPGAGTGALETLDHTLQTETPTSTDTVLAPLKEKIHAITGDGTRMTNAVSILVRMHNILNCRLSDDQLGRDRSTIHACTVNPAPAAVLQLCGPPLLNMCEPNDTSPLGPEVADHAAPKAAAVVTDAGAPQQGAGSASSAARVSDQLDAGAARDATFPVDATSAGR